MKKQYHDYTYKKLKEFLNALAIDCHGERPDITWSVREYHDKTVMVCYDVKYDIICEYSSLSQKSVALMMEVSKKGTVQL